MGMKRFGFHQSFINVIQAYDKPLARIKVNGDLSNQITLERGTRQGCPISPILFVLFIEPLNQWIRQNDKIIGIEMGTGVHKVAAFADDILVYLKQPTQSFPELMSLLETYGSFSGYKVNIQKTQVLSFNYKPPGFITRSFCLNWDSVSMRYLGVILSKDTSRLFQANFAPLISKIKTEISRWNLIPFLSMSSRVESVKMKILPRLLYLFQSLPVNIPIQQFIEWDKLFSRFIWKGKKPRIRFKTLQLLKGKGGMALPCLSDYF